jgi:hypothetical protein
MSDRITSLIIKKNCVTGGGTFVGCQGIFGESGQKSDESGRTVPSVGEKLV